jgi:protein CpxP
MRKPLLLAIAAASLAIAGGAFAQTGGAQSDGAPQEDLSRLHDSLHLSAAQEAAWKAYAAAIAPDTTLAARRHAAGAMMSTLSTPRRIDLINAEMEADMASMRRQGEAVKAFYAQLSPDQQKVFDSVTYQPPEAQGDAQSR